MTLCWESEIFVPILGLHLPSLVTLDNHATFQIHVYLIFYSILFFKILFIHLEKEGE